MVKESTGGVKPELQNGGVFLPWKLILWVFLIGTPTLLLSIGVPVLV